jgi:hypothetical protein
MPDKTRADRDSPRKRAAKPRVGARTVKDSQQAPSQPAQRPVKAGGQARKRLARRPAATAPPELQAPAAAPERPRRQRKPRTTASRAAGPRGAEQPPARSRKTPRPGAPPAEGVPVSRPEPAEPAPTGQAWADRDLTDEERIESAKYLAPDVPPRVFEEERFLFPRSYEVDRVRLLVKDPDWLFAYWDVNPRSLEAIRDTLGERSAVLSRLTLRIKDPVNGGTSVVYLPEGARSWYVRTDSSRRSYRAELGLTLPTGEFRSLAESNTVVTPRVGPSRERATRVLTYRQAFEVPREAALAVVAEEIRSASSAARPWIGAAPGAGPDAGVVPQATDGEGKADAGDARGASDVFRPGGASETFRR